MITVVEQVKYRFHYGFLNSAVPSLYFSLAKRRTVKIINGSDRCSIGMQESYFESVGISELSGVKDCENNKLKRHTI